MSKVLRDYQNDAVSAVCTEIHISPDNVLGRVVIPTGGGKTWVQAALLEFQREFNSKTRIHLVLAPRIMLANQLIREYRDYDNNKMLYRAVAFHSGDWDADDVEEFESFAWVEHNTTNVEDVKQAYKDAVKNGQDLVVFSTYHSCHKLLKVKFDTMIADESQYCTAEDFHEAVEKMQARIKLFFTATERHTVSDKGYGLNNEDVFGPRLYSITPAELIKKKVIVPPRLHFMHAQTDDEEKSVVNQVGEILLKQDELTANTLGFSKIIFAMKGTDDVKTVADNIKKIRKFTKTHDVFTITSKTGAQKNGEWMDRETFMSELKTSENAIICHYDILSEGIDVDGITGVAIMRGMSQSKLLQTIGRAMRIYKPAPELKKQAWVTVPVMNCDTSAKETISYFVKALRDGGYDVTKEDVEITGKERHMGDKAGVEDAYGEDDNNSSTGILKMVLHELEIDKFWKAVEVAAGVDSKLDAFFGV